MASKLEMYILFAIVGIISVAFSFHFYFLGYKHGQIDALTGKIKYELITQNPKWQYVREKE